MRSLKAVHGFAFAGAHLACTDKDGEVHELPLQPGPTDFTKYDPLVSDFEVEFVNVFIYRTPTGRIVDFKTDKHMETSADQNFQPSAKRLQEREVRLMAAQIIADDRKKAQKLQRQEQRRKARQAEREEARRIETEGKEPEVIDPEKKPLEKEGEE